MESIGEQRTRLKREAQDWLTLLLTGEATVSDGNRLKRWIAASGDNAAAFSEANRLWEQIGAAAANRALSSKKLSAAKSPSVPLSAPYKARKGTAASIRLSRRAVFSGAIAASASGAIYAAFSPPLYLWPSVAELSAEYRTGTGQRRAITGLQDCSIELNTKTSMNRLKVAGEEYRFELVSGEAAIATQARLARPVVVQAQGGQVRVIEGNANLRTTGRDVAVACESGTVTVEYGAQAVTLSSGEATSYGNLGLRAANTADVMSISAWREGKLVFRNTPLSAVIAEINRYRPGRLILINGDLGRKSVAANLSIDRIDDVIPLLADVYGAKVTHMPAGIVIIA